MRKRDRGSLDGWMENDDREIEIQMIQRERWREGEMINTIGR